MKNYLILFLSLFLIANETHAQGFFSKKWNVNSFKADKKSSYFGGGFYWGSEQDVLSEVVSKNLNEDRNYTMGFVYGKVGEKTNENNAILPFVRRNLSGLLLRPDTTTNTYIRFLLDEKKATHFISAIDFRVGAFTPRKIDTTIVVPFDRPYSCVLALSSNITRYFKSSDSSVPKFLKNSAITNRLSIGLLGTSVGREAQSKIHRENWFGSTRPVPEGWHNQIANDGGLVFLYSLGLSKELTNTENCNSSSLQVSANSEINLGYQTNLAFGMNFRFGYVTSPFWIGYSSLRDVSSSAVGSNKNFGLHFYFKPRLRFIGYNTLLQGHLVDFFDFGTTNHYLKSGDIERAIFEFETGVVLKVFDWTITFEPISGRSGEFDFGVIDGKKTKRWHFWGTINFALNIGAKQGKDDITIKDINRLKEADKEIRKKIKKNKEKIDSLKN